MDKPTRTCIARDVALLPDQGCLRVALILGTDGSPEELVLAPGSGHDRAWREKPEDGGLSLPPGALPGLLKALHHLEGVVHALGRKDGSR